MRAAARQRSIASVGGIARAALHYYASSATFGRTGAVPRARSGIDNVLILRSLPLWHEACFGGPRSVKRGSRLAKEAHMRSFLVVTIAAALGGCSVLDNIDVTPPALDPTLIYLLDETIYVDRRRDIDKYACLRGVMMCDQRAVTWECYCV